MTPAPIIAGAFSCRHKPRPSFRSCGVNTLQEPKARVFQTQPDRETLSAPVVHTLIPVWSRARVRDNSFTSGGRGPLHRRRSRVEAKQMHSTTAQLPSRQRPCPYQPSCRPSNPDLHSCASTFLLTQISTHARPPYNPDLHSCASTFLLTQISTHAGVVLRSGRPVASQGVAFEN